MCIVKVVTHTFTRTCMHKNVLVLFLPNCPADLHEIWFGCSVVSQNGLVHLPVTLRLLKIMKVKVHTLIRIV